MQHGCRLAAVTLGGGRRCPSRMLSGPHTLHGLAGRARPDQAAARTINTESRSASTFCWGKETREVRKMRETLRNLGGGRVHLELSGGTATLRLDNPVAANAVTGSMMAELGDAIDELERWDGACLHVTGTGSTFCSGSDLSLVSALSGDGAETMSRYMQHELTRLAHLPCVSVAVINGPAVGGGSEVSTVRVKPRRAGESGPKVLGDAVSAGPSSPRFRVAHPKLPQNASAGLRPPRDGRGRIHPVHPRSPRPQPWLGGRSPLGVSRRPRKRVGAPGHGLPSAWVLCLRAAPRPRRLQCAWPPPSILLR